MARHVESVLLALTETPGSSSPRAPELVSEAHALLKGRFSAGTLNQQSLESAQATKSKVLDAVRSACGRLKGAGAGLLVLAHSGHGGVTRTGHTWELYDGSLIDTELAELLAELPEKVEVVLISDCCYGSAILRPGVKINSVVIPIPAALNDFLSSPPSGGRIPGFVGVPWPLDALRERLEPMPNDLRALRQKLRTSVTRLAAGNAPLRDAKPRNTVCIASADITLSTDGTTKNRFAQCLRAVMESNAPPPRYDLLDDEMLELLANRGESHVEQKWWTVDAEPAVAAALPPFEP